MGHKSFPSQRIPLNYKTISSALLVLGQFGFWNFSGKRQKNQVPTAADQFLTDLQGIAILHWSCFCARSNEVFEILLPHRGYHNTLRPHILRKYWVKNCKSIPARKEMQRGDPTKPKIFSNVGVTYYTLTLKLFVANAKLWVITYFRIHLFFKGSISCE